MSEAIYGDSFGDLQRNSSAVAAARQAALARSLDTAVQSLQAARAHHAELMRMGQQGQQFEEEMSMRRAENDRQQIQQDRNFALAKAQADLNEKYYNLAVKQAADQITPAKQREHDFQFQEASSDADQGTFDSVEHVSKLYPTLTPAEQGVIYERSQQARRQVVNDNVTADNAANVLNKSASIKQRIYQIDTQDMPKAKKAAPMFGKDSTVSALQAERDQLVGEQQRIEPIADTLSKDKAVNNLVTFDPNTETYRSNLTKPRWMTPQARGGDNTGLNEEGNESAPDESTSSSSTASQPSSSRAASPPQPTATASTSNEPRVKVRMRDGTTGTVPQSQLDAFLKSKDAQVIPPPKSFEQNVEDTAGFLLTN